MPSYSPNRLRTIFRRKGWRRVVGFHTRNVPHRGHEAIQRQAMDRTEADGLLVSPVLSAGKAGDFRPDVVMRAHKMLIDRAPASDAFLAAFRSWPRFAGPREAVFTAQARRNYGCTHFIVGRDHSGVGDFYAPDAALRLFDHVGDLGIEPVAFDAVSALPGEGHTEGSSPDGRQISATIVRQLLAERKTLPEWLIDPEIACYLQSPETRSSGWFV